MGSHRREPGWTERVALLATSFRQVGLGRLGAYVLDPQDLASQQALRAALGADELVYLATCNRVEITVLLPHDVSPRDAAELHARVDAFFAARGVSSPASAFVVHTGRDALSHLFRVAAALDSLILGETQISGQARRAAERCLHDGLCGPSLHSLFERAVACARRVRAETGLGSAPRSAAAIAVQKVRRHFGPRGPGVSLLVGAGETIKKVAQALADLPGERIFVNRTRARAEELAARYGGRAMTLDELHAAPPAWVDLVFAATAATDVVVRREALLPAIAARRAAGVPMPLIVCDLGLPRDVDPALDALPGVVVVDMALVEHLAEADHAQGRAVLARALEVVLDEVEAVRRVDRLEALAQESARALCDERLAHLSPEDQAQVLRFATGLAARIARQPHSKP